MAELRLEGKEAWIALPQLAPEARFLCRVAGESNPDYFNALLAETEDVTRGAAGGRKPSEVTADSRARAKKLFAAHIIVGWEGVEFDDGKPAPFNQSNLKALLASMPGWMFDRLRMRAEQVETFLPARPSAEAIAAK